MDSLTLRRETTKFDARLFGVIAGSLICPRRSQPTKSGGSQVRYSPWPVLLLRTITPSRLTRCRFFFVPTHKDTAVYCLGLIATIVSVLAAAASSDDAAGRDLKMFHGNWSLISVERDGKKTPRDELAATKLAIQANKFVLRRNSVLVSEGTFTLDPARKPKEIDETITAGPNRGKVFKGIYEIDETHHRVCFGAAGRQRPTEFSSKPGSGRVLQVWRREKE